MAGAPLVCLLMLVISQAVAWLGKCQEGAKSKFSQLASKVLQNTLELGLMVGFLIVFAAIVLYPVARVYVLVESFAGLRSVDKGVYTTTEWTRFIPHAG
jgi:hypothetical protein